MRRGSGRPATRLRRAGSSRSYARAGARRAPRNVYVLVRTVGLDGPYGSSAGCRRLALNMARKRAAARVDDAPVPLPKRGPETVGSRLRVERERQGISLRELARRLDVSAS